MNKGSCGNKKGKKQGGFKTEKDFMNTKHLSRTLLQKAAKSKKKKGE